MNNELVAFIGFACCFGISLAAISIAGPLGLVDFPEGRRQHICPTARVGGLGIVLALLLHTALRGVGFPLSRLEYAAFFGMATLGFLDDRFDLRARWKAILGLALAMLLAYGAAHQILLSGNEVRLVGVLVSESFTLVFFLLVAMYWALPHAFNLIDGANGLATGYGLIVLGSLWAAGFPYPFLVGAMSACLCLNWPKARLFLGDTGSLSIGLLMVFLVYKALGGRGADHILWVFAYAIVDVTLVVLVRLYQRRNLSMGDRNHLHFQLVDRWPATAFWRVPALWLMAGMCASEIYVQGVWRVIPWLGLGMLIGTAGFLGFLSLRHSSLFEGFQRQAEKDESDRSVSSCIENPR